MRTGCSQRSTCASTQGRQVADLIDRNLFKETVKPDTAARADPADPTDNGADIGYHSRCEG